MKKLIIILIIGICTYSCADTGLQSRKYVVKKSKGHKCECKKRQVAKPAKQPGYFYFGRN